MVCCMCSRYYVPVTYGTVLKLMPIYDITFLLWVLRYRIFTSNHRDSCANCVLYVHCTGWTDCCQTSLTPPTTPGTASGSSPPYRHSHSSQVHYITLPNIMLQTILCRILGVVGDPLKSDPPKPFQWKQVLLIPLSTLEQTGGLLFLGVLEHFSAKGFSYRRLAV
jgi:hypothetical protein